MEKFELKDLYINSLGNESLGSENRKIRKSMFRVSLILKLWNDEIDQIKVKNFIHNLNYKKIDIKYQMTNMNIHIKLHLIIHFQ